MNLDVTMLGQRVTHHRVTTMTISTEPIGSIPRPLGLIEAVRASGGGSDSKLNSLYEEANKDTIERFEATGSPVITDGEQRMYHNFWTYSVPSRITTNFDSGSNQIQRFPNEEWCKDFGSTEKNL